MTVEEDGKEETKTITTGLVGDENTEVISGLKAGEKLVLPETTRGHRRLGGGEGSETGAFPGGGAFPSFSGGGAVASLRRAAAPSPGRAVSDRRSSR